MTALDGTSAADQILRPWQDPALPVADRVGALLENLTLEEKVGQLGSRWIGNDMQTDQGVEPDEDAAGPLNVAPMQDVFAASGTVPFEKAIRHGLGHLTRVFGSAPVTAAEGAAEVVRLQREVVRSSRLGIPALVHEECLTGFTSYGATVYPAAIAWGATFDPDLVERMAAAIGRDMRAVGVHQGLSPVLDVVRDYRWGRVEETMGEDPYLVAMLGAAYVRGLESAGIIATLKHFAGYSASRGARNHGPVPMGRRELLDMILPTFETAIVEGGARSVMNSYSDVDGVPAAADSWLLTDLLRDEWGFTGTVVSDYWAVPFLATTHQVAADTDEAGAQALTAGIDVELPDTLGFGQQLAERVRRGELPESLVDRAARRLLTQKVQLGLLDPGWTPEKSVAGAEAVDLDSPANRALARELAERSIVLLDAGTALPLLGEGRTEPRRVAVVGPCADDPRTFMGCYAFPNHVLPRHPGLGLGVDAPSLLDALRAELPGTELIYERGCDVRDQDRSGFAAALRAARESDLCVAVVGDLAGLFGQGTSGEGCDAEDLRLPGAQEDLLVELAATGTPVVVVVVSGRPYALGEVAGGAAALVQAFMPGEEGGAAIAGVLSGRVQPSGKLPVQIPRGPGGQPGTYLQPPLGSNSHGISNLDPTPLFPFGYGASYTTFEIGDLRVSDAEVPTDGEFTVSVLVRNTGGRAGEEVVQLYLHDVLAQVTRPVRQLAGFARVRLEPGASARATFTVPADRTAFTGRDLRRVVEPGDLEVFAGTSASDLPCRGHVRLTGPLRHVGRGRRLVTPVDVDRRRTRAPRDREGRMPASRRRATLATVAASAGVSVATVSKVLNGRSDVAPSTRSLVQSLLEQHDYVAPPQRRGEAAAAGTIEVEFDADLNAYSTEIVQGAVRAGAELDVAIVVSIRTNAGRTGVWARDLVAAGRRALIAVTGELTAGQLAALSRARLPLVVIDPLNLPQTQVTSVGSTNFAGGLAATQHLLALGHRRIAYLGGPATAACNQARLHGYRAAMEAAGAPIPPGHVRTGRFLYQDGVAGGAALLDLPEAPTAIFAGCDEIALGVLEATRARGLRVPEDLSIVGFDDTQLAQTASPPLTTVRQPLREMGGVAVRTALRLAAGERVDSHHVELATELVVRGSTTGTPARA